MKLQTPSIKLLLPVRQAMCLNQVLSTLFVLVVLIGSAFLSAKPAVAGEPEHTCDLSQGDPSSYEAECAQDCMQKTVLEIIDGVPAWVTRYVRVDPVNTIVVTKCIPSAATDYCCTERRKCGAEYKFNTDEQCRDSPTSPTYTYRYTENCLAFMAGCSASQ